MQAAALGSPAEPPFLWAPAARCAEPCYVSGCVPPRSADGVGVPGVRPAGDFSVGLSSYDRRVAGPRILP